MKKFLLLFLAMVCTAFGEGSENISVGTKTHVILAPVWMITGADTIYYVSATGILSPVTMGGNMTFSGGTLNSTGGTGAVTSVFGRSGVVTAQSNDYTFAQIGSKPTTLSGYGITDAQPLDGDLSAIAALVTDAFGRALLIKTSAADVRTYIGAGTSSFDGVFSSLTGTPTTLAGYGITDAQPLDSDLTAIAALVTDSFGRTLLTKTNAADVRAYIGAGTSSFDGTWGSLTGTPTTLTGYGITDAQPLDSDLSAISALVTDAFGRVLLTKTDAASVRSYIGAGTGSGTVTSVGLAGTANQITITGSSPITTSGSWTASIPTGAQLDVARLTNLTSNGPIIASGSSGILAVATLSTGLGYSDGTGNIFLDPDLQTIAGLTATTDNFMVAVSSAWASRTPSQVRTTLGLVIGTNVQAWDADLDTWATLTPSANFQTMVPHTFSQMRTDLGLVIGTNVQAWDADLDTWATKTAPSGTVVGTTDTQTLTNKRSTKRVLDTNVPSSPVTPDGDSYDGFIYRGINAALTINAFSGTPTSMQPYMFRFKDDGTGRALTFTTGSTWAFRPVVVSLPTTTVANKTTYLLVIANATDSRLDTLATGTEP